MLRPHFTTATIVLEGNRIALAVEKDLPDFKTRLASHELEAFKANVGLLAAGEGARTELLAFKVESGVHVAEARARIMHFATNVALDAHIVYKDEPAKQKEFGVGVHTSGGSTTEVRARAELLLAAAAKHPKDAAKVGLDHHGVHSLEELVHALDGADAAHVAATSQRHTETTHTDSLLHAVLAEIAHLRLIARRVFRDDPAKLEAYHSKLPRHEVIHRVVPKPPPPAPSAT